MGKWWLLILSTVLMLPAAGYMPRQASAQTIIAFQPSVQSALNLTEVPVLAMVYANHLAHGHWHDMGLMFATNGLYQDTQDKSLTGVIGPSQVQAYYQGIIAGYPDGQYQIYEVNWYPPARPGDLPNAIVVWKFHGTHRGSSVVAGKATNNQVDINGSDWISFVRDGNRILIIRVGSTYNGKSFADQDVGSGD